MSEPLVSVVVPARDVAGLIGAALDALAVQELDGPYEVIVVDNGSLDATAQVAESHPSRPRVLRRERGAGPGAARNDGARAARARVIAFTDADCRPVPGWLAAGLAAGADLVQGAVCEPPGAHVGPFDHTLRVRAEYGLYETANLFVARAWFDRVGGFEDIVEVGDGRPFGEDVWFAWRARRAGARTAFAPDALVHHEVFPGTVREYLRERARDGRFALLAARVPELRGVFFWRRWFFSRRSAAFDLALAGMLLRRPWLALPWLWLVRAETIGRTGVLSKRVALAVAAGDAVRFASLVRYGVSARRPLL